MRINCDVHDLALRSQVGCNHSPCCRGLGRAEGWEIHVRITTDSFANPGECVRPFLCALRNQSDDRMQKLLTWHAGHYAIVHFSALWYLQNHGTGNLFTDVRGSFLRAYLTRSIGNRSFQMEPG